MKRRSVTLALLLLSALSAPAFASSSVADRRDELAEVQQHIADPDPLKRLAYLEDIVDEGDPLKVEIAIRAAIASDDPTLRGLAMRAYVDNLDQLVFDWGYSPSLQREYDRAADDPRDLADFMRKYDYLPIHLYSKKVAFLFQDFDMRRSDFKVYSLTVENRPSNAYTGEGRVVGDRLVFRLPVYSGDACTVEVEATASLELKGGMNCNGWPEPWPISARMY